MNSLIFMVTLICARYRSNIDNIATCSTFMNINYACVHNTPSCVCACVHETIQAVSVCILYTVLKHHIIIILYHLLYNS